jgi:hypothetical protein
MNTSKWLRLVLFLGGCTLTSAAVPVFFSPEYMAQIHAWLGLGDFPNQPITIYLAKSASLLYAIHGLVLLFVAFQFKELHTIIPFLGWLHVAIGSAMIYVDNAAQMPGWWLVIEGPPVIAVGLLLIYLYWRARGKGQL